FPPKAELKNSRSAYRSSKPVGCHVVFSCHQPQAHASVSNRACQKHISNSKGGAGAFQQRIHERKLPLYVSVPWVQGNQVLPSQEDDLPIVPLTENDRGRIAGPVVEVFPQDVAVVLVERHDGCSLGADVHQDAVAFHDWGTRSPKKE